MYTHEKIVNIYIFYQLTGSNTDDNNPTVKNSLFGPVTLTKNADFDKHQYSGYGIGFDRRGRFLFERWWIWQKCNNFWSRYELFCLYR